MSVSFKNIDAVSALLKVKIEKNDYEELLNVNLRKIRQKVNMPGFRQGMVPLGLVKKMYGKQALVEEINRLLPEQINVYMRDNQVRILGEPMPNETEQKKIDFDVDTDFEFCYDIALSPVIDVQLTKADSLKSYKIIVDDEAVNKQIDSYRKSFGSQEMSDNVEIEDLVKGTLVEQEEKAPKVNGIVIEDAVLMPSYMKGKMEQKKFIGAQPGNSVVFNPYKAYKGAETELSSLLRIEKSAVKTMKSDYSFEIKEISRNKPAELNQEFFDNICGKDAAKSEAEMRDNIKESITRQYASIVENKTNKDIRDLLIKKADVTFADDILKRWLLASNENLTKEKVEEDFSRMIEDLKYHLVKEKIVSEHEISVTNQDVEAMAQLIIRAQYAQYGIYSISNDNMVAHVKELLNDKNTMNNLTDRVLDEKLFVLVKQLITLDEKEATLDEYSKIIKE